MSPRVGSRRLRSRLTVVAVFSLTAATMFAAPQYFITGVGAASVVAGKHAVGWLDKVMVESNAIRHEIKESDRIRSDQFVRVSVYAEEASATYDYQAIVGPNTAATNADSWIAADHSFHLNTLGFMFAWGYYPFVRDRWVSVGATGTTIALETYAAGKQRVYLLKGFDPDPIAKITCLANGKTFELHMIDAPTDPKPTYVDIQICSDDPPDPSGNWVLTRAVVPASGDAAVFKAKAEDIAKSGGWNE